jgi:hypothetical protein
MKCSIRPGIVARSAAQASHPNFAAVRQKGVKQRVQRSAAPAGTKWASRGSRERSTVAAAISVAVELGRSARKPI